MTTFCERVAGTLRLPEHESHRYGGHRSDFLSDGIFWVEVQHNHRQILVEVKGSFVAALVAELNRTTKCGSFDISTVCQFLKMFSGASSNSMYVRVVDTEKVGLENAIEIVRQALTPIRKLFGECECSMPKFAKKFRKMMKVIAKESATLEN